MYSMHCKPKALIGIKLANDVYEIPKLLYFEQVFIIDSQLLLVTKNLNINWRNGRTEICFALRVGSRPRGEINVGVQKTIQKSLSIEMSKQTNRQLSFKNANIKVKQNPLHTVPAADTTH